MYAYTANSLKVCLVILNIIVSYADGDYDRFHDKNKYPVSSLQECRDKAKEMANWEVSNVSSDHDIISDLNGIYVYQGLIHHFTIKCAYDHVHEKVLRR